MKHWNRYQKMKTLALGILFSFALLTACGQKQEKEASAASPGTLSVEDLEEPNQSGAGQNLLAEVSETLDPATEPMEMQDAVTNSTAPAESTQSTEPGTVTSITLDPSWEFADHSKINTGAAILYRATDNRKDLLIGVNAGHGTSGGTKVKTLCHPDGSAKTTGGSTGKGATEAAAVSTGMTFQDGTPERDVTLRMAQMLRDKLLSQGYDVLMLRDGEDVQLDNVARTVICNNVADCHIALHWDSGDGKDYDKGCFYISVPEGMKEMYPVKDHWQQHDTLGAKLVEGLQNQGVTIYGKGNMNIDLTQTAYSTIPSVDMELGNAYSDHSDDTLSVLGDGLVQGLNSYFASDI